MKALRIEHVGSLDDLEVRDVDDEPLQPNTVRIAVEAAGVNPSDVGVVLGHFPQVTLPRTLGRDFAGRVVEGPPELIGKAVWGSGGGTLGITRDGTHAEHVVLPIDAVIERPAVLSAQEAAVAGVPYVAAWSALVELGGFAVGQWAVVSGAAGAVGAAAVSLAKALGGHAIALVLSTDDLRPLDGLGAEAVLRSDADDVPATVHELTGGKGADVALNGVGAPVFTMLADSLAKCGRMVIYSAAGGRETPFNLFDFYRRRQQFFGLDTAQFDLAEIARLYEKFSPLFASGAIKAPPIAAIFPLARAPEAYELVKSGISGKVAIVPTGAPEGGAASAAAAASPSKSDAASVPALA